MLNLDIFQKYGLTKAIHGAPTITIFGSITNRVADAHAHSVEENRTPEMFPVLDPIPMLLIPWKYPFMFYEVALDCGL